MDIRTALTAGVSGARGPEELSSSKLAFGDRRLQFPVACHLLECVVGHQVKPIPCMKLPCYGCAEWSGQRSAHFGQNAHWLVPGDELPIFPPSSQQDGRVCGLRQRSAALHRIITSWLQGKGEIG